MTIDQKMVLKIMDEIKETDAKLAEQMATMIEEGNHTVSAPHALRILAKAFRERSFKDYMPTLN